MKQRAPLFLRVRLLALALALALAGCAGTASVNKVRASNATDTPATIEVEAFDPIARKVEFGHSFHVVQPGQALEVDHVFRSGRDFLVNVSASWRDGDELAQREGSQRVALPAGATLLVELTQERTLAIRVLVADRSRDGRARPHRQRAGRGRRDEGVKRARPDACRMRVVVALPAGATLLVELTQERTLAIRVLVADRSRDGRARPHRQRAGWLVATKE